VQRVRKSAEFVATAMFAAIFIFFLVAIFMRYVVGRPPAWPDELNMVLLLWTTFLAEALVLTDREQVTFDAVYDLSGPGARRAIGLAGSAIIVVLFLATLPTVWNYVAFLWRERTNVLQWRLDYVFSCFLVYWVAVIVRAAARFAALCRRDWREHVVPAGEPRSNVLG
jgi:TRAP-type C4-dicarboxylate transport system permease small subunit